MKSCPTCKRVYPDDAAFCPSDGQHLVSASLVPVAPTAEDARIGTLLGDRYEVRRVVADGGMGRVYEGIDRQKSRRVAVKVLHDDVARDDVARERFRREYDISASLPHDYIVEVLDFQHDEKNSVWLLVMEFLEGEELRFILKREKTMAPARLIRMLAHVAIGLDEAHRRSLIHRDLKPDNLFLCGTRDGDITKVLDFGSVKDKNKDAKKLTVMGTTIGSPFYMAPEQAQGLETLDARADVFALAAITYECIAGRVPFMGNNGPSILLAILTQDPKPVTEVAAHTAHPPPPGVDEVMEAALAKNPNIRTPSVGAFVDQLGRAYGLEGDHRGWAKSTEQVVAAELAVAKPRARAPIAEPVEAVKDPFAAPQAPAQRGPTGTQMIAPSNPAPPSVQGNANANTPQQQLSPARAMDAAFQATREAEYDDVAGLPSARPTWQLALGVAVVAVAVGGAVTFLVMR